MSDQKRNQNRDREQHQAGRDEMDQGIGSTSGNRDSLERADDRGVEREPRNVGGPREGNRPEGATTDEPFATDDIEPLDDDLDGSGHSNR